MLTAIDTLNHANHSKQCLSRHYIIEHILQGLFNNLEPLQIGRTLNLETMPQGGESGLGSTVWARNLSSRENEPRVIDKLA